MLTIRIISWLIVARFLFHRTAVAVITEDHPAFDDIKYKNFSKSQIRAAIRDSHEYGWLYSLRGDMPSVTNELRDAVLKGNTKQVEKLLSKELPSDDDACYLARYALIEGHLKTAEQLIKLKFKIDQLDLKKIHNIGTIPKCLIALLGELKMYRLIFTQLDYGADPDKHKDKILLAAKEEQWWVTDVMLKRLMQTNGGSFSNVIDKDGVAILHLLSAATNSSHLELFLANTSDDVSINLAVESTSKFRPGYTALHFASERCRSDSVRILLEHGADANAVDAHGKRPFDVSCKPWWYDGGNPLFSAIQIKAKNDTIKRLLSISREEL